MPSTSERLLTQGFSTGTCLERLTFYVPGGLLIYAVPPRPRPCHCTGALVSAGQLSMHPAALAALSGMGLMVGGALVFLALHDMRCQEEAYRRSSCYEAEQRRAPSSHSARSAPAASAEPQEDECAPPPYLCMLRLLQLESTQE